MPRTEAIAQAIRDDCGRDPDPGQRALGGGSINTAVRIDAGDARYFAKWNHHPLPAQFAAEAKGLEAMRAAHTGLVIPRVVAHADVPDEAFLLLEYLPSGRSGQHTDEELGRGLARLHRATSPKGFGFDIDGYCGATPQPNPWTTSWVDFYAEHRLRHQARLARANGMSRTDVAVLEAVAQRLPELLDDSERPALIHGDLWSGNFYVAEGGAPSLIDPAAYYAHREAELGMMRLFGGFSSRTYAAYEEEWPLLPGAEDRIPLYTLYHVLNHFNLFGGGYGPQAIGLARRYA